MNSLPQISYSSIKQLLMNENIIFSTNKRAPLDPGSVVTEINFKINKSGSDHDCCLLFINDMLSVIDYGDKSYDGRYSDEHLVTILHDILDK